jgi:hypothetical protein
MPVSQRVSEVFFGIEIFSDNIAVNLDCFQKYLIFKGQPRFIKPTLQPAADSI